MFRWGLRLLVSLGVTFVLDGFSILAHSYSRDERLRALPVHSQMMFVQMPSKSVSDKSVNVIKKERKLWRNLNLNSISTSSIKLWLRGRSNENEGVKTESSNNRCSRRYLLEKSFMATLSTAFVLDQGSNFQYGTAIANSATPPDSSKNNNEKNEQNEVNESMTDNDDGKSTDAIDDKTKKPQSRYSQLLPLSEKGYTVIGTRNDLMVIPKVTVGMWQTSGKSGFGYNPDISKSIESMDNYISAGFTSFDAADIYGPAESLIGEFRRERKGTVEDYEKGFINSVIDKRNRESRTNRKEKDVESQKIISDVSKVFVPDTNLIINTQHSAHSNGNIVKDSPTVFDLSPNPPPLTFFTKLVPPPVEMKKGQLKNLIGKSLKRMNTDRLDLLQFHWWDYEVPYYLDILDNLYELQQDGAIRHLGLTNFDSVHVAEISRTLPQIKIVSNQIQYSILDQRPKTLMTDICKGSGIALLCYGTLLGGFLNSKWIGKSRPSKESLETVSQRKYLRMIDVWGGWTLFQALLGVLDSIAIKYETSIPQVAIRWVIEQEQVATALVGTRLGYKDHIKDNGEVFQFNLQTEDYLEIDEITKKSKNLMKVIGDCGDEYRKNW